MSILGDLIKLYELWGSWEDGKLTEDEETLLLEVLRNEGKFRIESTDRTGEFVCVGQRKFEDDSDPSLRARFLEAVERLFRRGLVRHEAGILFTLSGSGFDAARRIDKGRS